MQWNDRNLKMEKVLLSHLVHLAANAGLFSADLCPVGFRCDWTSANFLWKVIL